MNAKLEYLHVKYHNFISSSRLLNKREEANELYKDICTGVLDVHKAISYEYLHKKLCPWWSKELNEIKREIKFYRFSHNMIDSNRLIQIKARKRAFRRIKRRNIFYMKK